MTTAHAKFRQWKARFQNAPLAASCIAALRPQSSAIWQQTFDLLRRESPEYRNSVDDEFTKESKLHCGELLKAIVAIAAGGAERSIDPFDFVRTHARWRARHQVPLAASLHAYRLAHKTYWGITRESVLSHAGREEALAALTMLSDFWIEFFDHIGAVLAEAHAIEEGLNAAQSTRASVNLMDALLRGMEPETVEAQRLRVLCGLQPGPPMAVAVARAFPSPNGKPIDQEVTLRSLVRLIHEVLPSGRFGKLVDLRNGDVIAILSSETDPGRGFLKAMRRHGVGRGAGVGVSLDALEVRGLPQALEEARLAVGFTGPAQALVHFAEIELQDFLVRHADRAAFRLIPTWARALTSDLADTVRAFAESSLNVKETARRVGVHTNTVYFRLGRVRDLTGVDARTFRGASLIVTALRMLEEQQRFV